MCGHDQEFGDPETMERLAEAVRALRSDISPGSIDRAAKAARVGLHDGNPWTRSVARGLGTVVSLARNGELAAARDLLDGELARALPADSVRV